MEKLEIKAASRLDGVGEYYFSTKLREIEQLRASGRRIINLGIGCPDLPPHPDVIEALNSSANQPNSHAYQPYKGSAMLREAFVSWYRRHYGVALDPQSEILPLMGSKEGLMHICMSYLDPGDRVLIPDPGYPTYRSAVTLSSGICVPYRLTADNGWMPDFDWLDKEATRVKMMIVNYPHMPTGAQPTERLFQRLVDYANRHNILLVHDNPYSFLRNERPMSLLSASGAMEMAVELNSLSKSHNMAGWRVGMVAGKKERIDQIVRFKSNMDSGMFLPVQQAAAVALGLDQSWYDALNATYRQREVLATQLLLSLGCRPDQGQAGLFLWAPLPDDYRGDCYDFTDKILHDNGLFITPGGIFGDEGLRYVRVSLCADESTLYEAISKIQGV